ncbi:MAG: hypothetical protein Q9169_006766 [Polycauliona sp. 2 TL-2023]
MSTDSTHNETRVDTLSKPSSLLLVDEIVGHVQAEDSMTAAALKVVDPQGVPLRKASTDLRGEALIMDDFAQLMKDNGLSNASEDDNKKYKDAEAIIKMFSKQSELMEKYTKHLELLEEQAKQPEPVEAVTVMVEQTHIQTEAILAVVEQEEDDFPEELQHQLETILIRTEEALERLLGRLKRKAAKAKASSKVVAPEILTPAGMSSDQD